LWRCTVFSFKINKNRGPTDKELKQTITLAADTIYHKKFNAIEQGGVPIQLSEVSSQIAGSYRLELERNFSAYQFHTISMITDKGNFRNAVAQTFAPGIEEEPMIVTRTKDTDPYKYDVISAVLALKRREKAVDEGIKQNSREIDAAVRSAIKDKLQNEKNTRDFA